MGKRTRGSIFGAFGVVCALSLMVLLPGSARATVFCHVADPHDATLNVRSAPRGEVINRLRNERVVIVFETRTGPRGKTWADVGGAYQGQWRNWGWVFRDSLRCVDRGALPREKLSKKTIKAVGILPDTVADMRPFETCLGVVPNGWGVTISRELYDHYRRRGFTKEAVCLALGSADVSYDPETGRQLPLYELSGGLIRPLRLSDCYRTVQVYPKTSYIIGWRPTGCTLRYHPTTGIRIHDPNAVELTSGGAAGGGTRRGRLEQHDFGRSAAAAGVRPIGAC